MVVAVPRPRSVGAVHEYAYVTVQAPFHSEVGGESNPTEQVCPQGERMSLRFCGGFGSEALCFGTFFFFSFSRKPFGFSLFAGLFLGGKVFSFGLFFRQSFCFGFFTSSLLYELTFPFGFSRSLFIIIFDPSSRFYTRNFGYFFYAGRKGDDNDIAQFFFPIRRGDSRSVMNICSVNPPCVMSSDFILLLRMYAMRSEVCMSFADAA